MSLAGLTRIIYDPYFTTIIAAQRQKNPKYSGSSSDNPGRVFEGLLSFCLVLHVVYIFGVINAQDIFENKTRSQPFSHTTAG